MNIKKVYISVLCIALSLCISISVFAEVNLDDFAYFADDGSLQYDMDSYYYAYAKDLVAHSGVDIDPFVYWVHDPVSGDYIGYNYDSFKADYDFAITALAPEQVDPTVTDISVDESADSDIAEDFIDDSVVDEPEISLLDTVLEDSASDIEEEVVVDIPHQYVVNDMRSGSVSSSYSLNNTDTDLTFEDIWGSSNHSVSNILTVDSVMFIKYTDGIWSVGFNRETPEIYLKEKYIYFPVSNVYLDSHWTVHDSKPSYSIGNSFNSIWGQHEHSISSSIFDSEHDIDQIYIYPDGTYNYCPYGSGVFLWETSKPITINLDKRYLFLSEIGVYITDNWQLSYTEPVINIPDSEGGLTGTLKDLIISIFGEYEPILTPTTFTETIDNVTTTTIIDAVASGSAGVDWEWCAGVFLFGIMLFCLFKLLGGIIS